MSFSPSSTSNLCMDNEIAGCVRSNFSAAREKLFSVATVKKTRSGCSSICNYYTTLEYYQFAKFSQQQDNLNRGTPMAERIYIFDTTLRDGEQSPGCSMTVPEKLKMAAKLVDLGVDILEAGFPIASDGDFEAVGAVAREFPWVNVAALARSNKLDVERAAQSLKNAKRPRIHTFIATSDIHLKHKLKKSRQQVLDEAVAAVSLARSYVDDVEFSAEDSTRTDWDYLEEVSKAVVSAGART